MPRMPDGAARMRIVQVSALYPPELHAGGTLACHALARTLARRGHEVSVFAGSWRRSDPPLHRRTYWYQGIPVETVQVASGFAPSVGSYRNPAVSERFQRYLERGAVDVVHFHSIQALGADLIAVAQKLGAVVIVTLHDSWFWCAQQFLTTPAPELR